MSQLKVDTITDELGTGSPDFPNGVSGDGSSLSGVIKTSGDQTISGTITATGFVGNGSGLTNLPAPPSTANFQEFTASGTWTKPAGVSTVYAEIISAGGSGGAARRSGGAAGGGGGGAVHHAFFQASALGSTVTVTVGAGGASRVRTSDGATAGAAGGSSAFGEITIAGGGAGGAGAAASGAVNGAGGLGFTVGDGDTARIVLENLEGGGSAWFDRSPVNTQSRNPIGGGGGGRAISVTGASTTGGVSPGYGNGGNGAASTSSSATATAGAFPGGGGGGAVDATSGAGAGGFVRVWCIRPQGV